MRGRGVRGPPDAPRSRRPAPDSRTARTRELHAARRVGGRYCARIRLPGNGPHEAELLFRTQRAHMYRRATIQRSLSYMQHNTDGTVIHAFQRSFACVGRRACVKVNCSESKIEQPRHPGTLNVRLPRSVVKLYTRAA